MPARRPAPRRADDAGRAQPAAPLPIVVLGFASLLLYLVALTLGDLRAITVPFLSLFFALFALYLLAVARAVREPGTSPRGLALILAFAVLFRLIALFGPPSLSDDVLRYVWDGRVQAAGISPYRYSPAAAELAELRDVEIWPRINRPGAITVYPPGAQLFFAAAYRLVPDSVTWTKLAVTLFDLATIPLLLALLRRRGLPAERVLIYAWSPLVVFEIAHSGHLEAVFFPFLLAAVLLAGRRPALAGAALGVATLVKLLPVLFLAAFVPLGPRRLGLLLAGFAATLLLGVLPYLEAGPAVFTYLPTYLREEFNGGFHRLLAVAAWRRWGLPGWEAVRLAFALIPLAVAAGVAFRPTRPFDPARAVYLLLGAYLATALSVHPWYVAALVPFLALFVRPGRFLLRADAATGWLLFSGLVTLSYTFFLDWQRIELALALEWSVLLFFLLLGAARSPWLAPRLGRLVLAD